MVDIQKVTVLGTGVIGPGIAQVFAQNGLCQVNLYNDKEAAVRNAMHRIQSNLSKLVEKTKLSAEIVDQIVGRIQPITDLKCAVKDADLIVEAVTEDSEIKKSLLSKVDKFAKQATLIVTNTSSINITDLSSAISQPERFAGMHFFNPAQIIRLVEVIPGKDTSQETIQAIVEISKRLGKEPVVIQKDTTGFVVNRVLMLALNEAATLVGEAIATPENVDKAVKLGLNWPMGPLALIDFIGVDTVVAISKVMEKDLGSKYGPSQVLLDMQLRGLLGRKTGKGFYNYTT